MAGRLRLDLVECALEGGRALARVRLSRDEDAREGAAGGPEAGWQRTVADATLRAVAAFLDGGIALSLDSVAEVRSGRYPLIVVTMVAHDGQREVFLSGAAPITDQPPAAVARAVLHGLNRWLEPILERDLRPRGAEAVRPVIH